DDYDGGTKVATMKLTWATTPDATSTYAIYAGGAPGSAPTASAVADAVHGKAIEGSYTAADLQRLIVSACVAMLNGYATGTLVYRDLLNTKNRFVSVVDKDVGRTSVSILDAT